MCNTLLDHVILVIYCALMRIIPSVKGKHVAEVTREGEEVQSASVNDNAPSKMKSHSLLARQRMKNFLY